MRRLLLAAAAALALSAPSAHAIVDGEPDGNDHTYVVAIRTPDARGLCTGTKLSERHILTAAHCLVPRTEVLVIFGENAGTSTDTIAGTIHRYGGWQSGFAGGVPGIDTNDVAIVETDEEMDGPFASLPGADFVGGLEMKQAVTTVGYGFRVRPKDMAGEVLERHRVTQQLVDAPHRIGEEYLRLSTSKGGPCVGDSGGPSLVGDTIVGITAFNVNGNCAGVSYAQRIDLPQLRTFIDGFLDD